MTSNALKLPLDLDLYILCGFVLYIMCLRVVQVYTQPSPAKLFRKATLCDSGSRMFKHHCMDWVSTNEPIQQCCIRCASMEGCVAASVHTYTGWCFLHSSCGQPLECHSEEPQYVHFVLSDFSEASINVTEPPPSRCKHGTWDPASNSCLCYYPFAGEKCERFPGFCREFVINGHGPGIYRLPGNISGYDDYLKFFDCQITEDEIRTFLFRNLGDGLRVNRTWDNYTEGFDDFGNPAYGIELWVGLKAMHSFSDTGTQDLAIKLTFEHNSSMIEEVHRYHGAVIGNSTTNFELKFTGYTKSLSNIADISWNVSMSDCLGPYNMTPFSTWDFDNDDIATENCALNAGIGWWFKGCDLTCNIMGDIRSSDFWSGSGKSFVLLPGIDKETVNSSLMSIEMYFVENY